MSFALFDGKEYFEVKDIDSFLDEIGKDLQLRYALAHENRLAYEIRKKLNELVEEGKLKRQGSGAVDKAHERFCERFKQRYLGNWNAVRFNMREILAKEEDVPRKHRQ